MSSSPSPSDARPKTSARFAVLFVFLVLDSAFLAVDHSPTLLHFVGVVAHMALGLALLVAYGVHRFRLGRRPGAWVAVLGLGLGVAAALGAYLMVVGSTRPHYGALAAHALVGALGATLLLVRLCWRAPEPSPVGVRLAAGAALVALGVAAAGVVKDRRDAPLKDRIVNPRTPPLTMDGEGGGPASPFFPSSARTNVGGTIPANFFLTSEACGRCHKDIYDQWKSSAHHFASFNNQWYRKSVEYMQDVVSTTPSKWCAGCHDHALFFNGRFDRPVREQIHTPEAQAGLGCLSCHAIVHVGSSMGQGDFTVEYPPLHDLATSRSPLVEWTHDYLLRVDPRPHREIFLKNFHRNQTPEFCSACHKVHLDVPVNHYRWFRGFNEYDNWQASGVSGEGARSFYYPPKPQKCAECHMPLVASNDPAAKDGRVRSHRFPGANTALPYVNGDAEQLKVTQDFLQNRQVSVDIFGLVRGAEPREPLRRSAGGAEEARLASTFGQGEESMSFGAPAAFLSEPGAVVAPLGQGETRVRAGESVRVEVVVRTLKVGHFFPGGTVDAFDVWTELQAIDATGREIFHSGGLQAEGRGPVDPGSHFYRSLLLDAHGNVINKRNAWMARSVAYVRLIPPGAADTVHYRLRIPSDCKGPLKLRAKLNYRKFSWWNTHWAFAGVRDPADAHPSVGPDHDDGRWLFTGDTSDVSGGMRRIPDIPTTVIASSEVSLSVVPPASPLPETKLPTEPSTRERWNDYGIGLLLQGDIRGAESAFLRVTELDPRYADGWVNVARGRIQEGNMASAEEVLRTALTLAPDLAKAHFFLAMALKGMGRYDEALDHLQLAARQYPRDRVVLNQIGRLLFLKRRYAEAMEALTRVMSIDPEDLQAHYTLMLCARGMGNAEAADREQKLYERFKADETSQFVTGDYRLLHPEDNNERQQIHEHVSASLERPPAPTLQGTRGAASGSEP